MLKRLTKPVRSLYVHVPFCARKCEYCAFYSEAGRADTVDRYTRALTLELALVAPDLRPETVFFGGGTPSLLTLAQWSSVFDTMRSLNLLGVAEFTVECNPATVSEDKARLLRDNGVNRVSMGVQSLDEGLLDRLGRVHSREMVFKSFDILRRAGFENINVDLMFAIPGQTMDIWRATMAEAIALGSEHLSCYEVIYEEDTPLFDQMKAGEFDVDEELAAAMFEELVATTAGNGFHQYEVANFARSDRPTADGLPSRACRHNVNYWRGGEFHGLGPSASGFVNGVRTKNWSNTDIYCDLLEKGRRAIESEDKLSALGRAGELAAFGLRMNAGWPFEQFAATTGFDLRHEWGADMEELTAQGWAEQDQQSFRLNSRGLRFADAAAEKFLRPA
jgi:oxygen-independent coproporphyrinogen-3 oxidase